MRISVVALGVMLLVLASVPVRAAGYLPVQQLTLERKNADAEIQILYPRTGNAAIDQQVEDWVKGAASGFAAMVKGEGTLPQGVKSSMDASFAVIRNDREMFEILFEVSTFTGGAHPNQSLHTLNFLLPDGERFYFAEIVRPGGMARISELATANLIKEIGSGPDPMTNEDMIRSGTVARPGAFETFSVLKDELVLYFSPYEVAAYAAGPQKTTIPLSKLRSVLRPRDEWRDPQPSFDCAKAATAVEKELCSVVALARLDRRVAEAYWWKLERADGDAAKARESEAQRAFLAARDAACGVQTDLALLMCLTGQYMKRLEDFEVRPE